MSKRDINTQVSNLVTGIHRGLCLMTPRERRLATLLVMMSLFGALLQTVTLVALIPMIQVMLDPSANLSGRFLSWLQPVVATSDRQSFLLQLAGGLAVLVAFKGVFTWLQLGWMSRFSSGCEVRLSSFMMKRILMAPYIWLVRQNSARLRQLMFGFVSVWSRDFIRSLMKLVNDLIFVLFIVAVLIWTNPISGLLVAAIATLLGSAIFMTVRPRLMRLAESKRRGVLGANSISTEAVLGVKEVKMAGAENRFASLFDEQMAIYSGSDAKAQQWNQLPRIVLEIFAYGSLIALSIVVVLSGVRDPDIGGVILLYALAAIRLLPIFATVVSGLATLVGSFPLIADLENLIASTQTVEPSASVGSAAESWQKVCLDNVSFRYQADDRLALDSVSISVVRGHSYGVVGPSGGGKSTLIDLIVGLLEPTSGVVTVDGHPLTADHRIVWRRRFGYVVQRPFLLDASLRDNITFNSETATDEACLQRVIGLARLEKVVDRLSGGLGGRVGEQGAFLSGGERQRVAIARALYRGADILILDEATSSLDPIVEKEIAESLTTLHGQVTTITVSHRLGLVRDCDEIWVFSDAGLSARGTHDELLSSSRLYCQMVRESARSIHDGTFSASDADCPIVVPAEQPKAG